MMAYILLLFAISAAFISGCGSGGRGDSSLQTGGPFTPSMNISNNTGDSEGPLMAFDGTGLVYAAWEDKTSGQSEIYFTRSYSSNNGRISFVQPYSIHKINSSSEENPRMSVDRFDRIHLSWLHNIPSLNSKELIYSHSLDGGVSFSYPVTLSNIDTSMVTYTIMAMDRFANLLFAWIEDKTLYTSSSIDGGQSFSKMTAVTQKGSPARPYATADENGVFYLVWEDEEMDDIYLARSYDSGLTFSQPKNISVNSGSSETPWIGVHGTDAYALWVDSTMGSRDIYIQRVSENNTPTINISQAFPGVSEGPLAGFDGTGNINVVWEDDSSGNSEVIYAKSSDKGASFSGFHNLSNTITTSIKPQINVSGGVIRVTWVEDVSPSNKELYLVTSQDSGLTFTPPVNISETAGISEDAVMGVAPSGKTQWLWVEGSGNREIYYRQER